MKGPDLPEEFEHDVWVTKFVYELHDYYGLPSSAAACLSKPERMQFLWARIGIANAMNKFEDTWRGMRGKLEPKLAAEEFSRRFYDEYGKFVVEEIPDFFINPTKLKGMMQKSLPNPKENLDEDGKKD